MTLTIPDWCRIGATVEYQYRPGEWVEETVHSYGTDGFFHQAYGCPMYYSAYSEFGRTIRMKGQPNPEPEVPKNREKYGKWSDMFRENPTAYHELRIMQIAIWYLCHNYGDLIAAYPKIRGLSERAEYQVESNDTAQRIYRRLENGEAKLTDFDFRVMRNCMRVSIREALREGEEKWESRS